MSNQISIGDEVEFNAGSRDHVILRKGSVVRIPRDGYPFYTVDYRGLEFTASTKDIIRKV